MVNRCVDASSAKGKHWQASGTLLPYVGATHDSQNRNNEPDDPQDEHRGFLKGISKPVFQCVFVSRSLGAELPTYRTIPLRWPEATVQVLK